MVAIQRRLILLAAALLFSLPVSPASGQSLPATASPAEGAAATLATTMSATDRMLVPVTIAGHGPYGFIVDTGAERTVIAREIAEQLNLRSAGRANLLSMTDRREVALVRAPAVSFREGASQDLAVFALSGEHIGASGILGIDALRDQRVVLDFDAGALSVGPAPRGHGRIDPQDIVVRGRRRFGQLVLADATAGDTPIDVVIDSGLQVSVGNEALRRLLASRRNNFVPIDLVSVTGQSTAAEYTRVDNVRIGGFEIRGLPVAFADAYFFRRLRLTRRPALILGMDALQGFSKVAVDFPNRRAHFLLRDGASPPAR